MSSRDTDFRKNRNFILLLSRDQRSRPYRPIAKPNIRIGLACAIRFAQSWTKAKCTFLVLMPFLLPSIAYAGWQIPAEREARAEIRFTEGDNIVFFLACAHNIVLSVKFPGNQQLRHAAAVTMSNDKSSIVIKGSIERDDHQPMFHALWTGKTQDPANLDRFMSILSSQQQLTFRAEGKKYTLPGIDKETLASYKQSC
jgi:hypothetical protein